MSAEQRADVLTILIDQHGRIEELFEQLATARGERQRELFTTLVELLAVHDSAEEHVVHPVARRKIGDGRTIVDDRLHEERELKHALAELYELGMEHPRFTEKLAALAEAAIEHARREEHDEFPGLRDAVSPEQLRSMAGALRVAEDVVPVQSRPRAGAAQPAPDPREPPSTVFDRAHDAVRAWRDANRHP